MNLYKFVWDNFNNVPRDIKRMDFNFLKGSGHAVHIKRYGIYKGVINSYIDLDFKGFPIEMQQNVVGPLVRILRDRIIEDILID